MDAVGAVNGAAVDNTEVVTSKPPKAPARRKEPKPPKPPVPAIPWGRSLHARGEPPPSEATGLVLFDQMASAIVAATSVDELKGIRDAAVAWQKCLHVARRKDLERRVAKLRIGAEMRAGAMLRSMEKAKGGQPYRRTDVGSRNRPVPTLADKGVTERESRDWQQMAAQPERVMAYLAATTELDEVPSTAGCVRAAQGVSDGVRPSDAAAERAEEDRRQRRDAYRAKDFIEWALFETQRFVPFNTIRGATSTDRREMLPQLKQLAAWVEAMYLAIVAAERQLDERFSPAAAMEQEVQP